MTIVPAVADLAMVGFKLPSAAGHLPTEISPRPGFVTQGCVPRMQKLTSTVAITVLGLLWVSLASAQQSVQYVAQPTPADVDARFATMQAEIDRLRSDVSEIERLPPVDYYTSLHGCGRPVGGWYGGVELVVVQPHFQSNSDLVAGYILGGSPPDLDDIDLDLLDDYVPPDIFASAQPTYGPQATPRFVGGVRNDDGLGLRARFWWLNSSADTHQDPFTFTLLDQSLRLQAYDFEVTQLTCLGSLEIELGAGFRYAHTETSTTVEPPFGFAFPSRFETTFDGVGPTASMQIRRPFASENWALVGAVRGSLLFGDSAYEYSALITDEIVFPISGGEIPQDLAPVLESQVGLERNWWGERTRIAFRASLEAQWWGSSVASIGRDPYYYDETVFLTNQDMGLIGATISLMIEH